jgi:uncharacterized protein YodC (DUF2158 family)
MKRYIVLLMVMLMTGCAGLGTSTRGDSERLKALEEKVTQLENEIIMGMAGSVGTNFYPARSLDGGLAGDLDKITGTSDNGSGDADSGFVTTDESESVTDYRHSIFFFKLDDNGIFCSAESLPGCLEAGDGSPEFWTLLHVWGRSFKTPQSAVSSDYIELFEDSDNGGNKITIDIADNLAADYTVTIPSVTATHVMARGGTAGNDYVIENEFIPVAWMNNDGAADPGPITTVSTTSNSREYECRQFDGTTDENLTFMWMVPEDLNTTNGIKYQVVLIDTSGGGATKDLEFEMEGESLGDNDSGDFATYSGSVQTSAIVDQTWTDDDIIFTTLSSAMTSTHIPNLAQGELVHFWFNRNADGNDDYAADVCVLGVIFRYTRQLENSF